MAKQVPRLPSAPAPLAPYSVATEANGFVFVSGQVAIDPTGGSTPTAIADQTRLILDNIGGVLSDLGLSYGDVVKATLFLSDIADFNTVNEVYRTYFPTDPPARSTFQVAALPRPEFKIEIEVIATR
ncbi:MAG TPA: RidA family protein [Acidimicrobiia bacterium]|jgi:2-iminobutanoate/2-iminopropanoate deaminase